MNEDDSALTRAEAAELARRAASKQSTLGRATEEESGPGTATTGDGRGAVGAVPGLRPGEGAMGEGLPHDWGGPRGGHPPGENIVSPLADGDERQIEGALRPKRLDDFVGQARVREQLTLLLRSALRRGRPPDHVLLSGPPGLGKTTIAMIIAAELGAPLRITSGPAIERSGDLAAVLSTLQEGEVVFIDEIHRLARPAEEMLYLAMEDFRVDIVVGKGPGATAIPLDIAPFTLVGATTRAGLLPAPLRDRFGFTAHLDFYQPEELGVIVRRSAGLLGMRIEDGGIEELALRSRGTPRIANRLLRRVRDYAEVRADGLVTRKLTKTALELYEVDELGLDRLDRGVLDALVRRFGGGPVGLSTLAVAVGEEAETVEVVAEPFLVRHGLLARTPRGRVATKAGWEHLGLVPPPSADTPTLFDLCALLLWPEQGEWKKLCSETVAISGRMSVPPRESRRSVTIHIGNLVGWLCVFHSAATLRRLARDRHGTTGLSASGKSTGRMPRSWGMSNQ